MENMILNADGTKRNNTVTVDSEYVLVGLRVGNKIIMNGNNVYYAVNNATAYIQNGIQNGMLVIRLKEGQHANTGDIIYARIRTDKEIIAGYNILVAEIM